MKITRILTWNGYFCCGFDSVDSSTVLVSSLTSIESWFMYHYTQNGHYDILYNYLVHWCFRNLKRLKKTYKSLIPLEKLKEHHITPNPVYIAVCHPLLRLFHFNAVAVGVGGRTGGHSRVIAFIKCQQLQYDTGFRDT